MIRVVVVLSLFSISCASYRIVNKKKLQEEIGQPENFAPSTEPSDGKLGEYREGNSVIFKGKDGFMLKATPHTLYEGEAVVFEGACPKGQLTWDFGDGRHFSGLNTKHIYVRSGSYQVKGVCVVPNKEAQTGTLSITVKAKKQPKQPGNKPNQSPNQNTHPHQNQCPCP